MYLIVLMILIFLFMPLLIISINKRHDSEFKAGLKKFIKEIGQNIFILLFLLFLMALFWGSFRSFDIDYRILAVFSVIIFIVLSYQGYKKVEANNSYHNNRPRAIGYLILIIAFGVLYYPTGHLISAHLNRNNFYGVIEISSNKFTYILANNFSLLFFIILTILSISVIVFIMKNKKRKKIKLNKKIKKNGDYNRRKKFCILNRI